MADINFWLGEFIREVDTYSSAVEYASSLPTTVDGKVAKKALDDMEAVGNRLKEVKKAYNLEIRLLRDKDKKAALEAQFGEVDNRFLEQMTKATECKGKFSKVNLMKGAQNIYDTKGKTSDDLLNGARVLQDKTFDSLGRTRNMIEESKQVGAATLDQLRAQREQMLEIEKEIDVMDSNLTRAGKLVTSFAKRMATDKIIQGFAALNIVVLLGLIIYVAVTGKSLSASSSDAPEPNLGPQTTYTPSFQPTDVPTN